MFKIMLFENRLTLLNTRFDQLFKTVCEHSESSATVMLLLHADWVMLKDASNKGGANSMRMLVALKAAVLENYLVVSTWI